MSDELREEIERQIHENELAKRRIYRKAWREKNKERLRQYQRGYRAQRKAREEQ